MKTDDLMPTAAPLPTIYVGEELTCCPTCRTRTELVAMLPTGARRERCANCGQHYNVVDDEDDD